MPSLTDIIVIAIVIAIIGSIIYYLYRQKKKGHHCVGCPYAGQCASSGGSNCGHDSNKSLS